MKIDGTEVHVGDRILIKGQPRQVWWKRVLVKLHIRKPPQVEPLNGIYLISRSNAEDLPEGWCSFHMKVEETIEGAPHCHECWHQFESNEDLINKDFEVSKIYNVNAVKAVDVDHVYVCPLCAHDL